MSTAGVSTLLALLVTTLCRATHLSERGEGDGSGSESGSGGSDDSSERVLGAEAIANIAASGAALVVLGGAMCYLLMCFNKQERMERVRAAQERNRQISRRLEAARQAKRGKQLAPPAAESSSVGEEGRAAGNLLFSAEHHSHLVDDEVGGASRDPSQLPLVTTPSSTSKHSLT